MIMVYESRTPELSNAALNMKYNVNSMEKNTLKLRFGLDLDLELD